jgi:hypothetical protein
MSVCTSRTTGAGSGGRLWQGCDSGERGGDFCCPGPGFGGAESGLSGGAGDSGGDVQEPVAQRLGFSGGQGAVEEEQLGPGEQVDGGEGELQPGGVDGEDTGREPAEAGVLAGADAVSDAGVAAVAGFEGPPPKL